MPIQQAVTSAVERLRGLLERQRAAVELSIYVKPTTRVVDGKVIHVDGYVRRGMPAREAFGLDRYKISDAQSADGGWIHVPNQDVAFHLKASDKVYKSTTGTILVLHEDKSWHTFPAKTSGPGGGPPITPADAPGGSAKAKGLLIAAHSKNYTKVKDAGEFLEEGAAGPTTPDEPFEDNVLSDEDAAAVAKLDAAGIDPETNNVAVPGDTITIYGQDVPLGNKDTLYETVNGGLAIKDMHGNWAVWPSTAPEAKKGPSLYKANSVIGKKLTQYANAGQMKPHAVDEPFGGPVTSIETGNIVLEAGALELPGASVVVDVGDVLYGFTAEDGVLKGMGGVAIRSGEDWRVVSPAKPGVLLYKKGGTVAKLLDKLEAAGELTPFVYKAPATNVVPAAWKKGHWIPVFGKKVALKPGDELYENPEGTQLYIRSKAGAWRVYANAGTVATYPSTSGGAASLENLKKKGPEYLVPHSIQDAFDGAEEASEPKPLTTVLEPADYGGATPYDPTAGATGSGVVVTTPVGDIELMDGEEAWKHTVDGAVLVKHADGGATFIPAMKNGTQPPTLKWDAGDAAQDQIGAAQSLADWEHIGTAKVFSDAEAELLDIADQASAELAPEVPTYAPGTEPAVGLKAPGAGFVAHLENTQPGHNKFYEVSATMDPTKGPLVTVSWGKIGGSVQSKQYPQPSLTKAWEFADAKVQSKFKEGYVQKSFVEIGPATADVGSTKISDASVTLPNGGSIPFAPAIYDVAIEGTFGTGVTGVRYKDGSWDVWSVANATDSPLHFEQGSVEAQQWDGVWADLKESGGKGAAYKIVASVAEDPKVVVKNPNTAGEPGTPPSWTEPPVVFDTDTVLTWKANVDTWSTTGHDAVAVRHANGTWTVFPDGLHKNGIGGKETDTSWEEALKTALEGSGDWVVVQQPTGAKLPSYESFTAGANQSSDTSPLQSGLGYPVTYGPYDEIKKSDEGAIAVIHPNGTVAMYPSQKNADDPPVWATTKETVAYVQDWTQLKPPLPQTPAPVAGLVDMFSSDAEYQKFLKALNKATTKAKFLTALGTWGVDPKDLMDAWNTMAATQDGTDPATTDIKVQIALHQSDEVTVGDASWPGGLDEGQWLMFVTGVTDAQTVQDQYDWMHELMEDAGTAPGQVSVQHPSVVATDTVLVGQTGAVGVKHADGTWTVFPDGLGNPSGAYDVGAKDLTESWEQQLKNALAGVSSWKVVQGGPADVTVAATAKVLAQHAGSPDAFTAKGEKEFYAVFDPNTGTLWTYQKKPVGSAVAANETLEFVGADTWVVKTYPVGNPIADAFVSNVNTGDTSWKWISPPPSAASEDLPENPLVEGTEYEPDVTQASITQAGVTVDLKLGDLVWADTSNKGESIVPAGYMIVHADGSATRFDSDGTVHELSGIAKEWPGPGWTPSNKFGFEHTPVAGIPASQQLGSTMGQPVIDLPDGTSLDFDPAQHDVVLKEIGTGTTAVRYKDGSWEVWSSGGGTLFQAGTDPAKGWDTIWGDAPNGQYSVVVGTSPEGKISGLVAQLDEDIAGKVVPLGSQKGITVPWGGKTVFNPKLHMAAFKSDDGTSLAVLHKNGKWKTYGTKAPSKITSGPDDPQNAVWEQAVQNGDLKLIAAAPEYAPAKPAEVEYDPAKHDVIISAANGPMMTAVRYKDGSWDVWGETGTLTHFAPDAPGAANWNAQWVKLLGTPYGSDGAWKISAGQTTTAPNNVVGPLQDHVATPAGLVEVFPGDELYDTLGGGGAIKHADGTWEAWYDQGEEYPSSPEVLEDLKEAGTLKPHPVDQPFKNAVAPQAAPAQPTTYVSPKAVVSEGSHKYLTVPWGGKTLFEHDKHSAAFTEKSPDGTVILLAVRKKDGTWRTYDANGNKQNFPMSSAKSVELDQMAADAMIGSDPNLTIVAWADGQDQTWMGASFTAPKQAGTAVPSTGVPVIDALTQAIAHAKASTSTYTPDVGKANTGVSELVALGDSDVAAFTDGPSVAKGVAWDKQFIQSHMTDKMYYTPNGMEGWSDLTTEEKVHIITDPAFRAQLKLRIDRIAAVKKWGPELISKSDKMAFGKHRARLETTLELATFLADVDDGGLSDDEMDAELAHLEQRMGWQKASAAFGAQWPVQMQGWFDIASQRVAYRKFANGTKDLGFDLDGDDEQAFRAYVKSHGNPYADGMNLAQLRAWVRADLKDPSLLLEVGPGAVPEAVFADVKMKQTQAAQLAVATANLEAAATKAGKYLAGLKSAQGLTEESQAVVLEAKKAKLKAALYPTLKNTYAFGPGGMLQDYPVGTITAFLQGSDGTWKKQFVADAGDGTHTTDWAPSNFGELLDTIVTGGLGPDAWHEGSDVYATTPLSKDKADAAALDYSKPLEVNAFIKAHGGNYLGKMDMAAKKRWVRAWIRGDEVGMFAIENNAAKSGKQPLTHKNLYTHAGSPETTSGQMALQNLANMLSLSEWGSALLKTGEKTYAVLDGNQRRQMVDELSLKIGTPWETTDTAKIPMSSVNGLVQEWLESHPNLPLPSPELSAGAQALKVEPEKPAAVPDATWAALDAMETVAATGGDPLAEFLGSIHISPEQAITMGTVSGDAELKKRLKSAPPWVARAWVWAQGGPFETPAFDGLAAALKAKLLAGWYATETPGSYGAVDTPNGPVLLEQGDTAYSLKGLDVGLDQGVAIVHKDGSATSYPGQGQAPKQIKSGDPLVASVKKKADVLLTPQTVSVPPLEVTKSDVATYGLFVPKAVHDEVATLEAMGVTDVRKKYGKLIADVATSEANLTAFQLGAPTVVSTNMSPPVALAYVALKKKGDTASMMLASLIEARAELGAYGFKTVPGTLDPESVYATQITHGNTSEDAVSTWWTTAQKKAFIEDYHLLPAGFDPYSDTATQAVANFLGGEPEAQLTNVQLMPTAEAAKPELTKDTSSAAPGGGVHTKAQYVDQFGRRYLCKPYANDKTSPKMRCDEEDAAAKISALFGSGGPPTWTQMLDGQYQVVQLMLGPEGVPTLAGVSVTSLTTAQKKQVAVEHVTDWLTSNHDSYYANFLMMPDGNIVPIDKGQAWKHFPNDKLAIGYMGGNMPVYYDELYQAVISHAISKEEADEIATAVLKKALREAKTHDGRVRDLLEDAFKNKPASSYPKGWDEEKLIDAIMARKAALPADFEKFWKDIYAKAGYEWDLPPLDKLGGQGVIELPDRPGEPPRTVFSGVSGELVDAVQKAQIQGVPTFYPGADLEEGTVLLWEEKTQTGTSHLVGETHVLQAGDKHILQWINQQQVTPDVKQSEVLSEAAPGSTLPKNDVWFDLIKQAAITVNFHAPGGKGEGEPPNASTLAQLEAARQEMIAAEASVAALVDDNTIGAIQIGGTTYGFDNMHQQQAFLSMVQMYLSQIAEIQDAAAKNQKTYTSHPNQKFYEQFTYVPPPAPKVKKEWGGGAGGALHVFQLDDGTWKIVNDAAGTSQVVTTKAEADAFIKENGLVTAAALKAQLAGKAKTIKVFKRKNTRTTGSWDYDTGVVTQGKGKVGGNLTEGDEYDIEIGTDAVIEYRAHASGTGKHKYSADGVPLSEQGLMRFEVKNWTGDEAQIQEIIDLLQQMGLDMTPADETGLQLLYWRMWSAVSNDRKGWDQGKRKELADAYAAWKKQYGGKASAEEELAFLKAEWAKVIGQDAVDNARWEPIVPHTRTHDAELRTGKPRWLRPDVKSGLAVDEMAAKGEIPIPVHGFYHGKPDGDKVVRTGAVMPTEERVRSLILSSSGDVTTGASSNPDQGYGSAEWLFTYPNQSNGNVYILPRRKAEIATFAYPEDDWGDITGAKATKRKDAGFTIESQTSGYNPQLHLKHGVTVLDDIIVMEVAHPQEMIQWLKAHGITTIRGVPVEQRIVADATMSDAKKLLKQEIEWRKKQGEV